MKKKKPKKVKSKKDTNQTLIQQIKRLSENKTNLEQRVLYLDIEVESLAKRNNELVSLTGELNSRLSENYRVIHSFMARLELKLDRANEVKNEKHS